MNNWFEQICLPNNRREIVRNPWAYKGGILVTDGRIAVLLHTTGHTYPEVSGQHNLQGISEFFAPREDGKLTTVEALRSWAGDFVFNRCSKCNGEGWVDCPCCKGGRDECDKCDDERDIECPECKMSGWVGLDYESRGKLGDITINLKLLAGIVNCVDPGKVDVYIPERVDGYRGQKPLLIIGNSWKAVIMPMRDDDGKSFDGWAG